MSFDDPRFGDLLRHFREAAGFSQEALAERAGLSPNAISALERGERKRPYPDTLRRLVEALGLDDGQRERLASSASRAAARPTPATIPSDAVAGLQELPGEPTPLIGRERETDVIKHLVTHSPGRLLTLTGPGGVGKTRLALHVARELRNEFPDGVLWVELAPLNDPDQVMPEIARVAGLKDRLIGHASAVVQTHLRGRRFLLVLDNFEHLLDAATPMSELLRACPNLVMLVTSRAPLSIRGEQEYTVPPLELPAAGHAHNLQDVCDTPSTQLFTWFARQKDPAFRLDDGNAAAIAAICERLDGLPLAMELAAPKLKLLGAPGLLARLERSLPILTGGARDVPARHRTMEAAIAWSYNLLAPPDQALFRRLSVFSGGWTLEAAEAIAGARDEALTDVLEGLTSLVDQSLVRHMRHDGASPRFTMLQTLREFGLRHLEASGERESAGRAHLQWCVELAESAEGALAGHRQTEWLNRLETELDNIRAALASTSEHGYDERLRLAGALWRFWWWRGHLSEGRKWLALLLEGPGPRSTNGRAKALMAMGILAWSQADYEQATATLEESVRIRRELGDTRGIGQTLNILGLVANSQAEYDQALALFDEALVLSRQADDRFGIANATSNIGNVVRDQGDFARAERLFTESMQIYRDLGAKRGIANTLHNLGRVARDQGQLPRAMDLFEQSLAIEHELGDRVNIAMTLHNLGRVSCDNGDLARAAALYRESLDIRRETGDKLGSIKITEDAIYLASATGDYVRAARLLGAASTLRATLGAPLPPADRIYIERAEARFRQHPDRDEVERAISTGATLTVDKLVDETLTLLDDLAGRSLDG